MRGARIWSPRFWKTRFFTALYIIATVLAIHDCFLILAHTVNPGFMDSAQPYILDKFLAALLTMFAM